MPYALPNTTKTGRVVLMLAIRSRHTMSGSRVCRWSGLAEDATGPYQTNVRGFADTWESLAFESVHEDSLPFIPSSPGLVLDIGAGSGRDSAWFASNGWQVFAVEPTSGLREYGASLHSLSHIQWIDDRLPGLEATLRLGISFDLLWLSAVWMHVAPNDRRRAFRKLALVLKPGGRLIVSLRQGPSPPDRYMHAVSVDEIEQLAAEHGLAVRATKRSPDRQGRDNVSWTVVVLELPDDGTGALPMIRGIILEDQKAATYKLALLRVLARVADQSSSTARYNDEFVDLPLGLVALYWIRMYKPLVQNDIPQAPGHQNRKGLGFLTAAFQAIDDISPFELRPGGIFAPPLGYWVARALGDAASTIDNMPAKHLTHRDGDRIFPTRYGRRPNVSRTCRLVIDSSLLWTYGTIAVPIRLWMTLRRLSAWIEPMLLSEWARLINGYAKRQQRAVSLDQINRALKWIDPLRDTTETRRTISVLLDSGKPIYCAWTGDRLRDLSMIEIDHCFPFSAWPCDDLWNLLPTSRRANQMKRDRLVTAELLVRSESRIQSWWTTAYLDAGKPLQAMQFNEEARSSLPIERQASEQLIARSCTSENEMSRAFFSSDLAHVANTGVIFEAMRYHRTRLYQDQRLPEWDGLTK